MAEYSLLPLWLSMKRRMAEITTHFKPWTRSEYVLKSMRSEYAVFRAIIGRVRLEPDHELPPQSQFLWIVQVAIQNDTNAAFMSLPEQGMRILTGSEGPEPIDTSGFPRWWLTVPVDLSNDRIARTPFNLSAWIIEQGREAVQREMEAQDADVLTFADELKDVIQSLRRLQASGLERSRAIMHLHDESVRVFLETHHARHVAATMAQRRYEDANGLSPAPVPFQVEIPEWNSSDG